MRRELSFNFQSQLISPCSPVSPSMTATTLFTFFPYIPFTCSVHILGSWDNFTTPYPLMKDTQKGHGHWVGAHSFKNVCCDGDFNQTVKRRNGGLLQGGVYYYYYKLDGDVDHVDQFAPIMSTCPMLPGQLVNILEVPIERPTTPEHDLFSEPSAVFTLDPRDKFMRLRKPTKRKLSVPFNIFSSKNDTGFASSGRRLSKAMAGLTSKASMTLSNASTPRSQVNLTTNSTAGMTMLSATLAKPTIPNLSRVRSQQSLHQRPPTRDGALSAARDSLACDSHDQDEDVNASIPVLHSSIELSNQDRGSQTLNDELFSLANPWVTSEASTQNSIEQHKNNSPLDTVAREPDGRHDCETTELVKSGDRLDTGFYNPQANDPSPHLETPPQLSSGFSTDCSPFSVVTPSPPRLRREQRKLQYPGDNTPPDSTETSLYTQPMQPPNEWTCSMTGEANLAGPEWICLDSPLRMVPKQSFQAQAEFENPFLTMEWIRRDLLDATKGIDSLYTTSTHVEATSLPNYGLGFENIESHGQAREYMLQDLAYLGSAIV